MTNSREIISREIYKQLDSLDTISQEEIECLYKKDGVEINIDNELKTIYNKY